MTTETKTEATEREIERAQRIAEQIGRKQRVNRERLEPFARASKQEHIDAASKYIALDATRDSELDGYYKVRNVELQLSGTYCRFGIVFVAEGQAACQTDGGPRIVGPWAQTFGLCTTIASSRVARKPSIEVESGDVLSINGIDFRVRAYRRDYLALDKIEADGTLTGCDF